jgi:hypothetical protein
MRKAQLDLYTAFHKEAKKKRVNLTNKCGERKTKVSPTVVAMKVRHRTRPVSVDYGDRPAKVA